MSKAETRILKRIMGLEPKTRKRLQRFVMLASDQGIAVRITQALRTEDEQHALYAQGRLTRDEVNRLRARAGMAQLGRMERNKIVTNARAGKSNHNFGLAFDVVIMSRVDKLVPQWVSPHWKTLGGIGRQVGLKWGGDWSRPDRPHFESPPEDEEQ